MKCTQCGCKKLMKIDLDDLFHVRGDGYLVVEKSTSVYACFECGHLEFFNSSRVERYQRCLLKVKELPNEIAPLRKQLATLEDPAYIANLRETVKKAEKQLKSLDITIRQQQELTILVHEKTNQINSFPREVKGLQDKISRLESALKDAEKELAKFEITE